MRPISGCRTNIRIIFRSGFSSRRRTAARVLFQKTADQRVASFLRSQGFAVDEIPEGESFEVAPGETMRIGRDGFYDSWNLFRADGRVILNINDCELKSERDLLRLRAEVGPIDVLLTQFSYAAWKAVRPTSRSASWRRGKSLPRFASRSLASSRSMSSHSPRSSTFRMSKISISTTRSTRLRMQLMSSIPPAPFRSS